MTAVERREEDRRLNEVSHEKILEKIIDHDDTIANMASDIRIIKDQIVPLVTGLKALMVLGKGFLGIGALALAATAIMTFANMVNGG